MTIKRTGHLVKVAAGVSCLLGSTLCLGQSDITHRNFRDSATTGQMTIADKYNFVDWTTGAVIKMSDPTILYLNGWYYITGSDIDSDHGNFRIFKTRDFHRFDLHKYAFSESNRHGRLMRASPGYDAKVLGGLYSPQLYMNPGDTNWVYLVFTATVGEVNGGPSVTPTYSNIYTVPTWDPDGVYTPTSVNPLFPWDDRWGTALTASEAATYWNQIPNTGNPTKDDAINQTIARANKYQSVYTCRISRTEFENTSAAYVFMNKANNYDNVIFFGYKNDAYSADVLYDGGQTFASPARQLPTSLFGYNITYQAKNAPFYWQPQWPSGPRYEPWGMGHRTAAGRLWSTRTVPVDGGFVFFDPRASDAPWLMYGFLRVGWLSDDNTNNQTDTQPELAERGQGIAGARLHAYQSSGDESWWRIDETADSTTSSGSSLRPFAFRKNTNNKIGSLDNGSVGRNGQLHAAEWCIAEGPAAIYDPSSGRAVYHTFYSRNFWDSPAYAVMARSHEPASGQAFASASLSAWTGTAVEGVAETMVASATSRTANWGRNYGGAEPFFLRDPTTGNLVTDSNGRRRLWIVFHAKMDSSNERTLFFKEMVYNSNQKSLAALSENASSVASDIWRFAVPQFFCPADIDRNGFVNGADYDDFADAFDASRITADFNEDGFVNGDDLDAFSEAFDSGC